MEWPLKVQGRLVYESDVDEIRKCLSDHPDWHRTRLSVELCRNWDWRRPDGQLKDMACREYLRKLEKRDLITLPPRRTSGARRLPKIESVSIDQSPVCCDFSALGKVTVSDARVNRDDERLFDGLVKDHHYLSFSRPVGQNMKYLVRSGENRVLGCLLFGSAAWKAADRDRFIGWSADERERNVNLITNNTRFLILPWVRVPNLASFALASSLKRLNRDWFRRYGSTLAMVETFVDTSRYLGTCYKAANWQLVGQTKGRSRQDRNHALSVPVKDVYVYPLHKEFREVLRQA